MSKASNLIGQRFGRLVVIARNGSNRRGQSLWLCQCECGKTVSTLGASLKRGNTKSCGCLSSDKVTARNTKHGESNTRLYHVWQGMKQRCEYQRHKNYPQYGGRGIALCSEWQNYENFKTWAINNGYKEGLSIDRINSDLGYEPDNCRWVDSITQARNKRNNHKINFNGETLTVSEWAQRLGVAPGTIRYRNNKGLPLNKISKNENN